MLKFMKNEINTLCNLNFRTELETRLEMFLAERKTGDNSQESEKDILSNGVDDQTIIIENCKHVIKEVRNFLFVKYNTIHYQCVSLI